jgi:hypothetical protein
MKQYLKSKGSEFWNSVVSKPCDLTTSKNISKVTVQRRARKNIEVALNILLNGLSDIVKTSIGLFTSAKDLWMKLENMYQIKNEEYSDIEAKVNLEDELESALDKLRKYKQSCKQLKDQLKTVEKFKKGTESLDKFLSLQRFPSNKFGLRYDHTHIIKGSSPIT